MIIIHIEQTIYNYYCFTVLNLTRVLVPLTGIAFTFESVQFIRAPAAFTAHRDANAIVYVYFTVIP